MPAIDFNEINELSYSGEAKHISQSRNEKRSDPVELIKLLMYISDVVFELIPLTPQIFPRFIECSGTHLKKIYTRRRSWWEEQIIGVSKCV